MLEVKQDIQSMLSEVICIRRALHKIPETGLNEMETTEYIMNYLNDLGLEVRRGVTGTGATAFLKVSNDAKTIAYRADIDALTVEEQTGADYCSTKKGYMHACGHDGHMAVLLGFAKHLVSIRETLDKNVLFIFQAAEEGPGGAEAIVKSGLLQEYKVECIFGLHIFPDIEEGVIACKPGPIMAQTGEFDIRIVGVSGHGAMPHKGVDALNAAVNTLQALNTIVSRNIDPLEPAVLTVGKMVCGERRNIIAKDAVLEGTMRAFSEETYNTVRGRLLDVAHSVPKAFNCDMEYEIRDMYPAVCNDDKLFNVFYEAIGQEHVEIIKPLTISEDFSYYQKVVPGVFFFLGSRNEELGYVYPLHNNRFNFNEEVLLKGIQAFYNLYQAI